MAKTKEKKKNQGNISYRKGHIGVILEQVSEHFKIDKEEVLEFVLRRFPELLVKEKCANCEASMAEYIYSVSILETGLLCEMAKIINKKVLSGIPFTEANKVHIQSEIENYTLASRTTISSKLGLVAKVMKTDSNGNIKHDQKAGWLITKRGFDFLSGNPIPKKVKVFRNEIQEHFGETVAMSEIYSQSPKDFNDIQEVSKFLIASYHNPKLL